MVSHGFKLTDSGVPCPFLSSAGLCSVPPQALDLPALCILQNAGKLHKTQVFNSCCCSQKMGEGMAGDCRDHVRCHFEGLRIIDCLYSGFRRGMAIGQGAERKLRHVSSDTGAISPYLERKGNPRTSQVPRSVVGVKTCLKAKRC